MWVAVSLMGPSITRSESSRAHTPQIPPIARDDTSAVSRHRFESLYGSFAVGTRIGSLCSTFLLFN